MQNATITLEDSMLFPHKTKRILPYSPEIMLLGTYPELLETYVYILYFIAALFVIDKTWSQPRCTVGEWINKLWYIQTMG